MRMDTWYQGRLAWAKSLIHAAEATLGRLTDGQRRDLLMDNTVWSRAVIREIVADVRREGVPVRREGVPG